jgi:hypothetical protein
MIDTQRYLAAMRLSGAPEQMIGYWNRNSGAIAPLVTGTNAAPYSLNAASLIAAYETAGAPIEIMSGVKLWADTVAYYYANYDTLIAIITGGGGGGGVLGANTQILGLPANLDTTLEITTAIEVLQSQVAALLIGGGGGGGSVTPTTPIAGLPPDLDTLAEMVALLQLLLARVNAIDANNNGIADTTDDIQNHAPDYVTIFNTGLLP